MGRQYQRNRKVQSCKECAKRAVRNHRNIPLQVLREFLVQQLRTRQARLRPRLQVIPTPSGVANTTAPCPNLGPTSASTSNASPIGSPNGPPIVPLPLGLGSITVPRGASRVDVNFNCVSNRLPTGHIKQNLVVNVDVLYNPPNPGNGSQDNSTPAKSKEKDSK